VPSSKASSRLFTATQLMAQQQAQLRTGGAPVAGRPNAKP
jgi:hypothetical protein